MDVLDADGRNGCPDDAASQRSGTKSGRSGCSDRLLRLLGLLLRQLDLLLLLRSNLFLLGFRGTNVAAVSRFPWMLLLLLLRLVQR